jgi:hypothetical protein
MTAIDIVEWPGIAGLDHMLEARRIDNAEDRPVAVELRDIRHVHAEMGADRRQCPRYQFVRMHRPSSRRDQIVERAGFPLFRMCYRVHVFQLHCQRHAARDARTLLRHLTTMPGHSFRTRQAALFPTTWLKFYF